MYMYDVMPTFDSLANNKKHGDSKLLAGLRGRNMNSV